MRKRPNILFLMTDQQRWDAIGRLNPDVKTPNLDALSRRGVLFDQAVCQAPICMPSRYSMMLGLYGCQTGLRHNTAEVSRDRDLPLPVIPQRMKALGYRTVGLGKTHWYVGNSITDAMGGPRLGRPESTRGFEVRAVARGPGGEENEPGAAIMGRERPEAWAALSREVKAFGGGGEAVGGYEGATSAVPAEDHKESWLTGKALDFLEKRRSRKKPFFLYLSFDDPHPGFNPPAEYEDLYDINDIPDRALPPWNPQKVGNWRHKRAWMKKSPRERRRTTLRYYALCSFVDDLFGRVLRKLEETGEADNTFILMTSDHGEMLGDRLHRFSKYCLYEGSVRVPLIIAGKGVPAGKRGKIDHRPAELTDVLPTFLDAAGAEIPDVLPGGSLLRDPCRQGAFCELNGSGYEGTQDAPYYMWRAKDWKLILNLPGEAVDAMTNLDRVKGELYDLKRDPDEWRNLYHSRKHFRKREELTRRLLLHLAGAWARFPAQGTVPLLRWRKGARTRGLGHVRTITAI